MFVFDDTSLVVAAAIELGVSILDECENMLPTATFLIMLSRVSGERMDCKEVFIAPRPVAEDGRLRRKLMFVAIVRFRKKY